MSNVMANKRKQIEFWRMVREAREGFVRPLCSLIPPDSLQWLDLWGDPEAKERCLELIRQGLTKNEAKEQLAKEGLVTFREGLVVFHPEPSKGYPYPETPRVFMRADTRIAFIKELKRILKLQMESAITTWKLSARRVRDPQMRQLIEHNFLRAIERCDETWEEIQKEVELLELQQKAQQRWEQR